MLSDLEAEEIDEAWGERGVDPDWGPYGAWWSDVVEVLYPERIDPASRAEADDAANNWEALVALWLGLPIDNDLPVADLRARYAAFLDPEEES